MDEGYLIRSNVMGPRLHGSFRLVGLPLDKKTILDYHRWVMLKLKRLLIDTLKVKKLDSDS